MLILFVAELAQSVAPSTIRTYLAGVRHLHITRGLPNPLEKSPRLDLAIAGAKRLTHQKNHVRLPITPLILQRMRGVMCLDQHNHKMLWAASLLGFYGFLRSAEFTVPAAQAYDLTSHLSPQDIAVDSHYNPSVIRVRIKKSKTDQFGQGTYVYIGKTNTDLCPVAAILTYMAARGMAPGPLFILQDGSHLTREKLVSLMREVLRSAGIDDTQYASHSFRIGAATTAAANGVQDTVIKSLGRWKSQAYQGYIQLPQHDLARIATILADLPG